MNGVGIDVGSKELVVVVSVKGKARQAKPLRIHLPDINLLSDFYQN